MSNFQETIMKLQEKDSLDPMEQELLDQLLQKQMELGDNPSDEEEDQALADIVKALLLEALGEHMNASHEDNWDDEMEENADIVRSVFDSMELHYRDYTHQPGVHAFELGTSNKGKRLRLKVYLEASPKVCRIDAILPFQADAALAYPLCEKLLQENYPRRYGALQYDARDGELSYRYSFPITHGLHRDDFQTIFLAVIASAHASYDVVRQYSAGRFRRDTRSKIICKAQQLILELDQ